MCVGALVYWHNRVYWHTGVLEYQRKKASGTSTECNVFVVSCCGEPV